MEEVAEIKKFFESCENTLIKKAHDYADDADCFSNFKHIASMCDIPVEKTFLVFMTVKLARIVQLLKKGKTEVGESIEDSLKDMANYSSLFAVYLKDSTK